MYFHQMDSQVTSRHTSLIQGLGIHAFSQPTSPALSWPRAPQNPRVAEGMVAESSTFVIATLVAAHAAEGEHSGTSGASSDDGNHSSFCRMMWTVQSPGLTKF